MRDLERNQADNIIVHEYEGEDKHLSGMSNEEFYRQLLEDQVALICRVDAEMKVIFANEAYCRFFSVSPAEAVGKSLRDLNILTFDSMQIDTFLHSLTPEQPIKKHLSAFQKAEGKMVWIEWTEKAFFDPEGRLLEIQTLGHDITELKMSQEKLQASRENFRQLAHTAPALIYISLPEENRLLWVNADFGDFMGYTFEECLSLRSWDLIHPDYREWMKIDSLDILRHKKHCSRQDIKIITKEGKVLWQDLAKSYIEFEGHPAILGVGYDVTERKLAEELLSQKNIELQASYLELEAKNREIVASQEQLLHLNKQLQESQERLELAMWGSDEGLWDWNLASGELFLNDRIIRRLGYNPVYFANQVDAWLAIMYPADQVYVLEKMKEHMQGKTDCYEVEYRLFSNTRELHWVFDRGRAVERDENGLVTRIVGMSMDITARKETEKAIIDARNRYLTLIAAIPELVVQVNVMLEFVWVNDQAKSFYGEAVLGTSIHNYFCDPHDYRKMLKGLEIFQETEYITFNIETWHYRQDGGKRLLNWVIKPLYEEKQIVAYLATARDLTEMHQAEEKIRYLSFHDSLTGLYNRAFAEEELQHLDIPGQLPLSIIMGDVNALKLSNDAFGHAEGDKLIQTIAEILKNSCRKGDIIARWGGDEFVLMLPRTSNKEAGGVCQRVRQLCSLAPAAPIQPSVSLGVATKENPEQNIYEVLEIAEDGMYRNKLLESASLRKAIIASLEQHLHERTHETRDHVQRMQELAILFAAELGLPVNDLERLVLLAKLHDVGKLGVPEWILNKPERLNEEEWESIKKHTEIGFRITTASHDLISIADEVLSHHENWDGSGYPRGLSGKEIPYLARIISIVDSYEVMTCGRLYKAVLRSQEALNEIRNGAGSQYDPELAVSFIRFMLA